MDPPSGRVPGSAPEKFLVATEACSDGTPDLSSVLEVLGYMEIYRRKKYVRGGTRGSRGWRARPLPRGLLEAALTCTPSPLDHVRSKNNAPEAFIPFGLHSIFLFFETLK